MQLLSFCPEWLKYSYSEKTENAVHVFKQKYNFYYQEGKGFSFQFYFHCKN